VAVPEIVTSPVDHEGPLLDETENEPPAPVTVIDDDNPLAAPPKRKRRRK
jgi:hypothetical protein